MPCSEKSLFSFVTLLFLSTSACRDGLFDILHLFSDIHVIGHSYVFHLFYLYSIGSTEVQAWLGRSVCTNLISLSRRVALVSCQNRRQGRGIDDMRPYKMKNRSVTETWYQPVWELRWGFKTLTPALTFSGIFFLGLFCLAVIIMPSWLGAQFEPWETKVKIHHTNQKCTVELSQAADSFPLSGLQDLLMEPQDESESCKASWVSFEKRKFSVFYGTRNSCSPMPSVIPQPESHESNSQSYIFF